MALSRHCSQLESIAFTNFHVLAEVDPRVSHCPVPLTPAKFPFLRNVRLSNVVIEDFGKDVFRYLIGGAHDIESLYVSFKVRRGIEDTMNGILSLFYSDLRLLLL